MKREEATNVYEYSKLHTQRLLAIPTWREILKYSMKPPEMFTVDDIAEPMGEQNGMIYKEFQVLEAMKSIEITDVREHRSEHPVGKIPDHYIRINPPFWRMARHVVNYTYDTYPEA